MFHKKPSPACSGRTRASAVGAAAQTATSQRGSSCGRGRGKGEEEEERRSGEDGDSGRDVEVAAAGLESVTRSDPDSSPRRSPACRRGSAAPARHNERHTEKPFTAP
ncbi:hypothetical protein EYF80_010780 [Liparis tanakae]|uniref:Uncharacterized protein n=1 Tax=Liparis tanakae TaxID=230148 RepID=A0A4Z2IMT6_9TELE|nr:hypothetical protein EYF80_010780 [Liparis tanakae]